MKRLKIKPYPALQEKLPDSGRHIIAHYDQDSVVVYQAYSEKIGRAAAREGNLFVSGFSLDRMSWIKPGFFWMMHRSQWGTAQGQRLVLAIWLQRSAFEQILAQAVPSHYDQALYPEKVAWENALETSDVRLQWDPDWSPDDQKLPRRALQLGLRGETLRKYAKDWILHIDSMADFITRQAEFRSDPEFLFAPAERVYPVSDPALARRLRLSEVE